MEPLLRRFVEWVLAHQRICIAAVVAVTLLSVSMFFDITFRTTLAGLFFGDDHAEYSRYEDRTAQFGVDETILVGVEVDEPFSKENIEKLDLLHGELGALDFVFRVSSIQSIRRVGLVDNTIAVRSFADEAKLDPSRARALLEEARADPLISKRLVSIEKPYFIVVVDYRAGKRSAESASGRIDTIHGAFETAGYDRSTYHIAGGPAVMSALIEASYDNLRTVLPIVLLCLLLSVFLMFGRFWPAIVTTISAVVAVSWTMGFALYLDPYLNIMMTIVPALVMVISFSDVVHICSAYLLKLDEGTPKREAVIEASVEVGSACFLTSVTTAVGFISMAFVPTPMFQRVGTVSALGVCIAFVVAVVIVPIILLAMKTPKRWTGGSGRTQRAMDRVLDLCASISTTRPKLVIVLFTAFIGSAIFFATKVEIETVFSERLSADNPAREAEEFLRSHFVNSTSFHVYIETANDGDVLRSDFFDRLVAFESQVEELDNVGKVMSLADLMQTTHRAVVGDDSDVKFSPTNDESLAQLMLLIEQQGPDAVSDLVDFPRKTIRITVLTEEPGIVGADDVRQNVIAIAANTFDDDTVVDALGIGPMMGAWVDNIVQGQKRGLLFSLLLIALILVVSFRSLRVGLFSMIPNVFPLLGILGLVGAAWDKMDSDVLIIMMIAIGIGVDDTIHFLARLKIESKRTDNADEAIRRTFKFSGRGIVITTFVFMVGFAPMLLGDYFTIQVMGYMLPYCFFLALIADLLLLPAMAAVGWIRFDSDQP